MTIFYEESGNTINSYPPGYGGLFSNTSNDKSVNNYRNTLLGTCINHTISGSTGTCGCEYPVTQSNCFGYFIPSSESLCGSTASEGHSGGCCMYDTENNTIIPCQQTTYCGCHALASRFNFEFKWTKFKSGQSCKDIECVGSVSGLGACCNGKGLCSEVSEELCTRNKLFFQGVGTRCIMGEKSICIEGTGGCADGFTLESGVVGASCIESGKVFTGTQKNPTEFYTATNNLPCEYVAVPLTELKYGDLVADGMFIGIYRPGRSECYGRPEFNFNNLDELMNGASQENVIYIPSYDWDGYGSEKSDLCDSEDSYAMVLSLNPMTIEYTDDLTSRIEEIDTFSFSRGGPDWGPNISPQGRIIETDSIQIKSMIEGYAWDSSLSNHLNMKLLTEQSCEKRLNTSGFNQKSNGRWSRDWGFNNTYRINAAELFRFSGLTLDGNLSASDYINTETENTPMILGVREANRFKVINQENESSWFVPSLNELAYIAFQCKYNNLNEILINSDGFPITGTHWSSTGSFTDQEGILNGGTASSGSVAWTMTFPDGMNYAYTTEKTTRTQRNNVRLIKFIKCNDTTIPTIHKRIPISL